MQTTRNIRTGITRTRNNLKFLALAAALMTGCASDRTPTKAAPNPQASAETGAGSTDHQNAAKPSKIKFGEFKSVELKATELNPGENNEANQESAKTIDGILVADLKRIWPNLKVIPKGREFSKSGQRTLQIAPRITHIKIVSTSARVWVGMLAGGSDMAMQVTYRDSASGGVIANPDFTQDSSAWTGAWTMSATDKLIRDAIVQSIVSYTKANK